MDVRLPDGTVIQNVPDGMSKADLTAKLQSNGYDISKLSATPNEGMPKERTMMQEVMQAPAGIYRGFKDVTDTLIKGGASAVDYLAGTNARQAVDQAAAQSAKDYEQTYGNSAMAGTGRIVGNVAATAPVGGLVAAPLKAIGVAAPIVESVASSGFRTGIAPTNIATRAIDLGVRGAGGAITGGASAGLVNPEDTTIGAAVGAAIPTVAAPVLKQVAKGLGFAKDIVTGRAAEVRAADIVRQSLGDSFDIATIALANARPGITAVQALQEAGINADPFMALGKLAEKMDTKSAYRLLMESQELSQANRLAAMAGGANQTTARQSAEGSINALNANVVPKGQAALDRANIGNTVTKGVQPEIDSAVARRDLPSFDNAPSLATSQTQLDALSAAGLKPIDTSTIINNIKGKLADPKIGPSDVNSGVLSKVVSKIEEWTAKGGGYLDAEALYTIRKNAVNEEVQRLMGAATPTAQARYAAKLLGEINPAIDNAIETAGGKGWKDYLTEYAAGRQKVEQKKMAAQIKGMFDNGQKQQLIDLVRGNNPDAVEAVFGPGSYSVFQEMAPRMPQLNKIANQIERDIKVGEQAAAGAGGLARIMGISESKIQKIPAFFSVTATTINKALDILEGKINNEVKQIIVDGMKNGKSVAELVKTLPAKDRGVVLRTLMKSDKWNPEAVTAPVQLFVDRTNNLAPENRNNLRQ
jgi:hypothetical protein